jgi:hypothetical protein
MAGPSSYNLAQRRQIATGLLSLVPGTPQSVTDAVGGMSEAGVDALITTAGRDIDGNIRPQRRSPGFAAMLRGETAAPADERGAKERLQELLRRETSPGSRLTAPQEIRALESAMAASGYRMTLDGAFSDGERSLMGDFQRRLTEGMTLSGIFGANAEIAQQQAARDAQVAQENQRAAQAQGNTYAQYTSGLVYAGYLRPEDVNDKSRAAEALSNLISNTMPPGRQADELRSMFSNLDAMDPNQRALDYIRGAMPSNITQIRLQQDLESGDPARIRQAQGFMALQGVQVNGQPVEINGAIYSREFADAAQELVRRPIGLPTGDGSRPTTQQLYGLAATGQVFLPENAIDLLSPGHREVALAYPPASQARPGETSREGFIAARLISEDPARYQALLAEENTRRANTTLRLVSVENIAPVVRENQQTLQAVALPANLAETAVRYARDNGGQIRVEHIPYVLGQANGDATSMTGGIDYARAAGQRAGLTPDQLSANISLDPNSPTFAADMNRFLQTAYVLQNASAGARMDNIPADVTQQLQRVAETQSQVSTSLVDQNLTQLGLPQNLLTNLRGAATPQGELMLVQLPNVMITTDRHGLGRTVQGNNFTGMVVGTGIEAMTGDPAIDAINSRDGRININDPRELAVAMQMTIAMRDGRSLDEVRARPGLVYQTQAVAQGYLGQDAAPTPARSTPASPIQERPATTPEVPVAGQGGSWLSRMFGFSAEAAPAAPAAEPAQTPERRPAASPAEANPWVYTPGA